MRHGVLSETRAWIYRDSQVGGLHCAPVFAALAAGNEPPPPARHHWAWLLAAGCWLLAAGCWLRPGCWGVASVVWRLRAA